MSEEKAGLISKLIELATIRETRKNNKNLGKDAPSQINDILFFMGTANSDIDTKYIFKYLGSQGYLFVPSQEVRRFLSSHSVANAVQVSPSSIEELEYRDGYEDCRSMYRQLLSEKTPEETLYELQKYYNENTVQRN